MFHEDRLAGVHPDLVQGIKELADELPFDIGIPKFGGPRTDDDQVKLFSLGRDATEQVVREIQGPGIPAPGKRVTWAKDTTETAHGVKEDGLSYGADVAPWDAAKLQPDYSDPRKFQLIGEKAKEKGFTWGGDWPSPKTDTDHIEITGWQTLVQKVEQEISDVATATFETVKGHAVVWLLGGVALLGGLIGFAIWRAHT